MSEELKPQDGLGLDGDEELMTDFADLFDDDEIDTPASEASPDDSDDNSLDELDAFLDDFERNLDIPDAGSGNDAATAITDDFDEADEVDEVAAENESPQLAASPERDVALDKAELDLDVGLDGEIFVDEVTLDEDEDEPESASNVDEEDELVAVAQDDELLEFDAMLEEEEPALVPGQADLALDTPPPAAAAATAAALSAAAVADSTPPRSTHGAILPPPAAPALSRAQLIGGVVVLSLSLLLSLAALWMGLGLGAQIDVLNQNVSELQQRLLSQSRRGTIAPQAQLGEQLNRLGERVNELAVIVEGPVGHLRESTQQELQALGLRLDRLEQGNSVQPQPVVAVTSSKPLVSKAEPVMAAAATAKSGGWVINLLSVSSAGTAKEELGRLRKLGIRADQQAVTQQGKTWYRLRVTGFDSYAGAKAYIDTVEKQTGFRSAWVAKE